MKGVILENRNKGFRAGAVIVKEGKILLMHQYLGPREIEGKGAEDFYTLPGGSWEVDETLEQTCKREIKEECGIDIAVGKLIFYIDTESRLAFYFVGETSETDISLGGPEKDRMSDYEKYTVEWIELEKINDLTFIPAPAKDALLKYLEDPNQPTFFLTTNK